MKKCAARKCRSWVCLKMTQLQCLMGCQGHHAILCNSNRFIFGDNIVYVEWASRVNYVTIFGDLYQNKLWVISNNLNQFAHLSSASGPRNNVIKMVAIVLHICTHIRHRI